MPSSRWNIVSLDPGTGKLLDSKGAALAAVQVIDYLRCHTNFDPDELAKYAVGDAGTLKRFTSAERWMADHAVQYVISAWTAGAPAARKARQDKLREWWPDLGFALDNLEVNSAEA